MAGTTLTRSTAVKRDPLTGVISENDLPGKTPQEVADFIKPVTDLWYAPLGAGSIAYNTTLQVVTANTPVSGAGVTLSAPVGTKLQFNALPSSGALPASVTAQVSGAAVAVLDFVTDYTNSRFQLTLPSGAVYSGPGNVFTTTSPLTLT